MAWFWNSPQSAGHYGYYSCRRHGEAERYYVIEGGGGGMSRSGRKCVG